MAISIALKEATEARYKTESLDGRAERQLVQRAQSGNSEAFGILYDGLVDRIYRYVYFRVTDQSTAEDLTSTIFLRPGKNWAGIKWPPHPSAPGCLPSPIMWS